MIKPVLMTLNKSFLHSDPKFIHISGYRFIAGFVIGLFYAFAFYAFLYLNREAFRITSLTEEYDLWVLTDEEVTFYNLIYAFIALILAQSICFTFWFDRPKRLFDKRNYRKTSAVHDQRVLNWNFLSWFSKLAFIYGILFGHTFSSGFYVHSLYPTFNHLFVLFIIVLYFQTWTTIRLTFKHKSTKWLVTSIVIVSCVSFGLSKINLIDYKAINSSYLKKSIYYKYTLELPQSKNYEVVPVRRSSVKRIYLVETKQKRVHAVPILVIDNQEIALKDIGKKIKEWQSTFNEHEVYSLVVQLQVHRAIKMDYVNKVKKELASAGVEKIAYGITPTAAEYNKRYYKDYAFIRPLIKANAQYFTYKELNQAFKEYENIIEVKQLDAGEYLVNDIKIDPAKFKQTLKQSIRAKPDYYIKLYINDKVSTL